MFWNDCLIELTLQYFYILLSILIYWSIVKLIQFIIIYLNVYSSNIALWSISFLDLRYPSTSLMKPFFVHCWLVCIIFIWSEFIDPETCPWMWLKTSTTFTYRFSYPIGLWKVVVRMHVLVMAPVAIITLIGFKTVPQGY